MRAPLARMLVAGRWMRGVYGGVKGVTFGWVLLLQPVPPLHPEALATWGPTLDAGPTAAGPMGRQ